jgi:hypothetical protein
MRIISVSRRTDIPAFYSRWFLKRIEEGFCHWMNPFGGQVYRVSLRPEDCLALVFWTRNPKPLVPHLDSLRDRGFYFYFHMTINGYPNAVESNNPPLAAAIDTFRRVSAQVSPDFIHWRYDPILLSEITPPAYHVERFDEISRHLQGFTKRCYFSFVDFYGKTERNLARVEREHGLHFERPGFERQWEVVQQLRDLAAARGITMYSCCDAELAREGIAGSRCIDVDVVHQLRPDAEFHLRHAPTRQDCGCVEATDIGAYDTCAFGCAYCYATNSRAAALERQRHHDPNDTILWRPAALRGADLDQVLGRPPARSRRTARTKIASVVSAEPAHHRQTAWRTNSSR